MAKNKKSKILAIALCASVMTGIYASPVMAADIKVEEGSTLNGVATSNSTDYTITSGTLKLDGADIANALNGKNINLGTGSLIINDQNIGNSVAAIRRVVNKDTGMSATYLEETVKAHSAFGLQVLDEDGKAVATISRNGTGEFNGPLTANKSLTALDVDSKAKSVLGVSGVQLYNSDGTNKVNITNSGASRFGSFDETNVRIEGGALKIMAPNNEPDAAVSGPLVAQLSEDGLTLVDADRKYSTLTAVQLANLNSTIKEGGVVDANELNVSGATGGLYVRDVVDGKTMIYTKAADADGTNTVWIDPENGNISTIGTVGVTDDLESGKLITQIQGSGENIGDIAVGIQYDGAGNITGQNIVLDASTGDVISKGTLSGTGLAAEGASGGLYVRDVVDGKTMIYTKAADADGTNTVWIDPENGNISTIGTVGVTDDLESGKLMTQIQGSGENIGDIAVGIQYDGEGNITGQNIVLDASTGDVISKGDVTTLNDDGSEKYSLNTIGEQVDGIGADLGDNGRLGGITREDKIGNDDIFDTTTIEGSTSFDAKGMVVGDNAVVANADGSFSAANGAFGVSKDGAVRVQSSDLLINNGSKDESIAMTDGGLSLITTGDNGTGMVTLSNGTVSLRGGSTSTVTINGDGTTFGTLLGNETTNINGGTVTASNDFVTTNEDGTKKYTLNTVGNNLKDLSDDFKTTNANVAGIERTYNELYDTYTTHIEGALHISENAISTNGDIFNFSYDLGNGYTGFRNLGKLAIDVDNLLSDVSDLTGRIETVEGKTEHISVDESGNTTISSPNGDTTLTVSDDGITMNGDTVMNGDSTTGGEGGSGDGSVTNPDSDHIVNGGQEVNNGQTVNGGQVVNDGQTVNGDAQFNDQVTVGDTDDNQTVINGGNVTVDNSATVGGSEGTSITGGGVTVGGSEGTTVGKDGVTVGGSDGVSIKDDGMTVGGENGTVVSDSDVVINSGTENEVSLSDVGNRVDNLEQGVAELNNRVGELEDRIDKVGAMAAAIANLRTMGYDPAAPTEVAVGIGQYRDETGAALGLFHYPNRDFMLSLSVSTSGDEVMGGIGATWKFGRKSPEKVAEIKKAQAEADVRRAEEAKLAKAEEMKQAAKEAKIKAQQERHAKLAAERAAQAEAAK